MSESSDVRHQENIKNALAYLMIDPGHVPPPDHTGRNSEPSFHALDSDGRIVASLRSIPDIDDSHLALVLVDYEPLHPADREIFSFNYNNGHVGHFPAQGRELQYGETPEERMDRKLAEVKDRWHLPELQIPDSF